MYNLVIKNPDGYYAQFCNNVERSESAITILIWVQYMLQNMVNHHLAKRSSDVS